uniref:Signal transduction histidine kinase n=1 Tax=uncultured marine thaumarchaeote KM3_200_B02 TaxID=1456093 RepID=A0A075GTW3_9ARCH|nr:signal transduction histidine kinase [uncultured marine thaumarchaeote KM3_200_B02]
MILAKKIKFRVAARLINHLGTKSITSNRTAVFELVKNSRDANSSQVDIDFEDGKIIIEDDGDGMTEDEVIENWFTLGTESRLRNDKTAKGKQRWGEMGIGRFACEKLSHSTVLKTVPRNHNTITTTSFSWDSWNRPGTLLEDSESELDTKDKRRDQTHGTTLELSGLKEKWTTSMIGALKEELSMLVASESFDDIKIRINDETVGTDLKSMKKRVLDNCPYKLKAEFDGDIMTAKIYDVWNNQKTWKELDPVDFDDVKTGRFKIEIFFFPRGTGGHSKTIEKYYEHRIGTERLDYFIKKHHGMYLEKDGAWLAPYGGSNDWLGMEARRVQSSADIGLRQIHGRIILTKKNNSEIKQAAHRETIIQNEEFKDLKGIVLRVLIQLRDYYKAAKKREEKKEFEAMGGKGTREESHSVAISQMKQGIKRSQLPKYEKDVYLRRLAGVEELYTVKDQEAEERIAEMGRIRHHENALLTLGLATSFMAHEVSTPLNEIINTVKRLRELMEQQDYSKPIPTKKVEERWRLLEAMTKNTDKIRHFMKFVDVISEDIASSIKREGRAKQISVLKTWISVSDGFESIKEEIGLAIFEPDDDKRREMIVKMNPIDLECILTNLYVNSIESLRRRKSGKEKLVDFDFSYAQDTGLHIEFKDNGIGIPENKLEKIFEAFDSSGFLSAGQEYHHKGMGLYVAKRIVDVYNGTIEAVSHGRDKGATFVINLPRVKLVG